MAAVLGGELLLTVRYQLRERQGLLDALYEVAADQLVLREDDPAARFAAAAPAGTLRIADKTVSGEGFSVTFDPKSGFIRSFRLRDVELLAGPLAKIFVGYDAGLLALTTHGMKLYCISFILSGFNIFGSAFFTALNNGTVSAAISFLRTLLFQVVSILTLPLIIGVDGIWLAVVAAEAMALVCTGGFVVRGRKRYGYL